MILPKRKWPFLIAGTLSLGLLVIGIATVATANTSPNDDEDVIKAPGPPRQPPMAGAPPLPGPVNVINPTLPANPGPPQMYGAFRLIPYGYVGPIPHTDDPSTGVPPNWRS